MIKFFRNIRQNLLLDGKTGKPVSQQWRYLKYAIGEIVLVVIGILLAVQINYLSENRKNQQKRKRNASILIENLLADSLYIADWKARKEEDIRTIDGFKARINSPAATIDTLLQIAQNEYVPGINTIEFKKDVAFKTLVSSGEINLFESDLVENIYNIYSTQEFVKTRNDNSFNTYLTYIRTYVQRYTFNSEHILTQGPLYAKLWDNVDETDLIGNFNAMAGHKYIFYNQLTDGMARTELLINNLLSELRKISK